ncbi:MAG: hypothetical protein V1824_00870 [archaeon]
MAKTSKQDIKQKINFILDFAINESKAENFNNPYISEYIKLIIRLAKSINYRLPSKMHLLICKNCNCLRTSSNTIIRTERHKINKKINKYLKIHCLNCNYIKKINLTKVLKPSIINNKSQN